LRRPARFVPKRGRAEFVIHFANRSAPLACREAPQRPKHDTIRSLLGRASGSLGRVHSRFATQILLASCSRRQRNTPRNVNHQRSNRLSIIDVTIRGSPFPGILIWVPERMTVRKNQHLLDTVPILLPRLVRNSKTRQRLREPLLAGFELLWQREKCLILETFGEIPSHE
jgi:hypothetical protein